MTFIHVKHNQIRPLFPSAQDTCYTRSDAPRLLYMSLHFRRTQIQGMQFSGYVFQSAKLHSDVVRWEIPIPLPVILDLNPCRIPSATEGSNNHLVLMKFHSSDMFSWYMLLINLPNPSCETVDGTIYWHVVGDLCSPYHGSLIATSSLSSQNSNMG